MYSIVWGYIQMDTGIKNYYTQEFNKGIYAWSTPQFSHPFTSEHAENPESFSFLCGIMLVSCIVHALCCRMQHYFWEFRVISHFFLIINLFIKYVQPNTFYTKTLRSLLIDSLLSLNYILTSYYTHPFVCTA